MSRLPLILIVACATLASHAQGQISFKDSLIRSNPVPQGVTFTFEEKVKVHRDFLNSATTDKEPLKQLFGCIYLFSDHVLATDYAEATRYLLEAQGIAAASGNIGWLGEVVSRQAIISIRMEKKAEAAQQFGEAARLFGQSGDTLRMAECLEQLGATYIQGEDYANAQKQYALALPLLEKYGTERQMRVALGNFGNIFLMQDQPAAAIPYFERALAINRRLGDREKEAQELGDLANAHARLKNYGQAMEHYQQSVQIAEDLHLLEVLSVTYSDMAGTYEQMGDYRAALDFFKKYHALRDSSIGAETQEEIAALQIQYETQKNQADLAAANKSIRYRSILAVLALVCLVLAVLVALKLWQDRSRNAKIHQAEQKVLQQDLKLKELEQTQIAGRLSANQKDLTNLALDIARKNDFVEELLQRIEAFQFTFQQPGGNNEFRELEQFILSHHQLDQDKSVFQENINEINREFIEKLNDRFGQLSPTENDLCGLIRLNLSNKQIAAIKSISPNSAKIARYRLRKRLQLEAEQDIVAFLQAL